MFNHRLVSLFYRAWEKYRSVIQWEAAAAEKNGPDPITHGLFDVIGMGTAGLRSRMRIPDAPLLFYAGLIAQRPHSASALRGILRDYFAVPVEIDQCLGNWYPLEERDRCYLNTEEERCQLGVGAFLGDEVWDQQARFRIRVGPVGLDRFKSFLPEGTGMAELIELTRFLVGVAAPFEVQLILEAEEVPYCRLTDEGDEAPRLGWMAWLKTGDFTANAADAVFAYVN
jgi:type VI secretion system protein ImpH